MICGLALILLMDASGSVNQAAWQAQLEAHADALADPAIGRAMAGQGATAVTVIAFGDAPHVLVPWRVVDAAADAEGPAREVMAAQRPEHGGTHTGRALGFALDHLERAPCVPERAVIDIVTDGPNDDRARLAEARERAIAQDVRINALVINTYPAADPVGWAREELITPGGFVVEADSWADVAAALRRKVTWEISAR